MQVNPSPNSGSHPSSLQHVKNDVTEIAQHTLPKLNWRSNKNISATTKMPSSQETGKTLSLSSKLFTHAA